VACAGALYAAPAPIVMDGVFDDWSEITPIYEDPAGDGGASGIDFGRLWVADDPEFLFIRFELGTELLLSDNNSLTIYLDTDMNSSTGLAVNGIGAELKWVFGSQRGWYYRSGWDWTVYQADVSFRASPSVSAVEFEIAFGRDSYPNDSDPLFFGSQLRIFLRDNTGGGDGLPAVGQTLAYEMDAGSPPVDVPIPLGKLEASDLRIITLNVKQDGPWEPGQGDRYGRQMAALQPEILSFQEIYNHTHFETRELVESWLPSDPEESWYSQANQDCHVVSRYRIVGLWNLDGNVALLIDTEPVLGKRLLIINCHLPCCDDDEGRQAEVDRILWFLRDAKSPGGSVTLDEDTPILITGDMNFVGLAQQLNSFLTGDIVDEGTWGEDFDPDWDGSTLTNLISIQTEKRMAYTWRKNYGSNWPGHLDFMIYSDSVVDVGNHFILYTPEMSADSLDAYGLSASDSNVTDHILVCADFRPRLADSVEEFDAGEPALTEIPLWIDPNPADSAVRFGFEIPRASEIVLEVFDAGGRRVATPIGPSGRSFSAGQMALVWDSRDAQGRRLPPGFSAGQMALVWDSRDAQGRRLPPGTYFIRLRGRDAHGAFQRSGKWTILR
jgi:hypothetical protein